MPLDDLCSDVILACGLLDEIMGKAAAGSVEAIQDAVMVTIAARVAYQRLEDSGDYAGAFDLIRAFADGGQA